MICAMGSEVYALQQTDWTGNINVFLGSKTLDDDDWDPIDKQDEFGIKVDFRQRSWPVSIAIEYSYSSDEDDMLIWDPFFGYVDLDIEGNTSELCFGVRKIWDHFPMVRPFIGGGIAFISAEFELSALGDSVSDDDTAFGIWIGGGVYWTISEHFNIGLDLKWSEAQEVTLFGVDGEAGGSHFGLLVGYHW
jgi:hypothetical protein